MARILLLLLTAFSLIAAPHVGETFNFKQPDGSEVEVNVWGDEFYQRVESPAGYTLVRDDEGWITYADITNDGSELISTGERYYGDSRSAAPSHRKQRVMLSADARYRAVQNSPFYIEENKSRAGSKLIKGDVTGDVIGLTILIDFSDQKSAIPAATLENFLNQKGFNQYSCNGSVRDYYADVSGGAVDYTNIVTAFYRPQYPKSYYDANEQAGSKAIQLIKEALNGVKNEVDFSTLTQRDGAAIALNILYAGEPTYGWAKGLWPHQFQLNNYRVGGYTFNKYQITNIGNSLKLSTFCHENGHMIGQWPDLYDYQSDGSNASGIGNYGLMCFMGDSKNPVPPNAYFRYLVGWDQLKDITTAKEGTLLTINSNKNEAYIYRNTSNSNEFFVVEAREQKGRSASLPSEGLMIYHVDKSMPHNDYEQMSSNQHYMVSLEQADGRYSLEKNPNHGGDAGDLFTSRNGNSFTDKTYPDANWWNGRESGLHLGNISAAGPQMTFTIGDQMVVSHTIEASAGTGGSISPEGSVTVADGENQTFNITAEDGYVIEDVLVNGASEGAIGTYTFNNVTFDQTISASFTQDLSLKIVAPNGGEELPLGETVEVSWSGEIAGTAALVLLRSGTVVDTLSKDLSGNSYEWLISEDLTESSSYKLRIFDDNSEDESDASFTIKKIVISPNLLDFADWYVIQDQYSGAQKSTAELDTTEFTIGGWVGGNFTIGAKDTANNIYPYASLVTGVKDSLADMTALTVTYRADAPYKIRLDQKDLSETGESFQADLPESSTWNTIVIPLSAFKIPGWSNHTTPLKLEDVSSISFGIDDQYGRSTSIKVKNLQLYGYEPTLDPVSHAVTSQKMIKELEINSVAKESIQLRVATPGMYTIELFSLTGRKLFSTNQQITKERATLSLNSALSSQITLLRVRGMNHESVHRLVIQ